MMRKPDCLICGTQKGGTRALIDYLSQHHNVYAYPHEPNFFSLYYHKGLDWYLRFFKDAEPDQLIIEKSPQYMYTPCAAERIKMTCPDVKLIFILRDPVKRAYSHYWMNRMKGKEHRSFSRAIRECSHQQEPCIYNYISRGFYDVQLKKYKDLFPSSQIFILQSSDLRNHTQLTLDRVCDFLGLEHFTYIPIRTKQGTMPRSNVWTFLLGCRVLSKKEYRVIRVVKELLTKWNKGDPYPPMDVNDKKYLEDIYDKTES